MISAFICTFIYLYQCESDFSRFNADLYQVWIDDFIVNHAVMCRVLGAFELLIVLIVVPCLFEYIKRKIKES